MVAQTIVSAIARGQTIEWNRTRAAGGGAVVMEWR